MDYNNDKNMWDWQGDYGLQEDIPKSLWSSLNCENEDDLSYMFDDEATPVKACGDLPYHVADYDNMDKGQEQCSETSSQVKRRRMLQFDTEVLDVLPLCDDGISSSFLKSKEREDSIEEAISDMSQWVSGFADDTSASGSGYDGLDSSENWLADCFNDTEMHFSPDDMNSSGTSDVQAEVTEIRNTQPECEANTVQQQRPARPRRNIIFKGKKSYMKTPTKVASAVVYPFAFVKPCGMQGAVTLKDINQRILTPPPLKSKQNKADATPQYPTSAFSGKPVVGKTKIRTEGGKGSITIMRTKGFAIPLHPMTEIKPRLPPQ